MIKFSIPNIPSFTSTKANLDGILFVPNINVITKFISGDLSSIEEGVAGFSDIMTKRNIANNLKLCKTVEEFEIYRDINNIELQNEASFYFNGVNASIPMDDIKLPLGDNYSGLKAFERSIIQALLETQKPYMEIYKGVSGSMVKIEDIIACVLAVGGRSLKPMNNPRALGYTKNKNLLMGSLNAMSTIGSLSTSVSKGSITDGITINSSSTITNDKSIKYSTGDFEAGVNYEYRYEYYNENKVIVDTSYDVGIDVDTKPPVIVFGIYNSKGELLPNNEIPKWLIDSKKFYGQFERLTNYSYKWTKGKQTILSIEEPSGRKWKRETYRDDITINGYSFKKGEPVIYQNGTHNQDLYKEYFNSEVNKELGALDLSVGDIKKIQNDINERMYSGEPSNLKIMLDLLVESNYLKGYDGVDIPLTRNAFIPREIEYNTQKMFIDPETEYDMKVIKVDTSNNVQYYDTKSKQVVVAKLVSYDTSGIEIGIKSITSNSIRFSAMVYNGDVVIQQHNNVSGIFISEPDINAKYKVIITEVNNKLHSQTIIVEKNPNKGDRITYLLSHKIGSSKYMQSTKVSKNVTNTVLIESLSGKKQRIGIELLLNNKLVTSKPYSNGIYGEDIDYTIDTLSRFQDYNGDDETYYIVEGILESTNDNYANIDIVGNGGKSGRGYYKIKDVLKVFRKFISLIIQMATKIFPPINKTLQLLSNPMGLPQFLLDIVSGKLGDDFGQGNVKFKTFSSKFSSDVSKSTVVIENLKNTPSSDLVKKQNIQAYLKSSPIGDFFYVEDDLSVKCLLDGKSLTELFGITFGVGVADFMPKLFLHKSLPTNLLSNTKVSTPPNSSLSSNTTVGSYINDSVLSGNLASIISKDVSTNVSVVYSTGEYIEGVDYKYTYLSEAVSKTINMGDALKVDGDIIGALKVYQKGIIEDPNNSTLEHRYSDTIAELGKNYLYELGLHNPLMDMALGMITTPVKLIKGIIDYILEFFKSLSNPFSLPGKIVDFISFKWFQEFFSKEGLLSLLGIKLNMKNLKKLVESDTDIDLSEVVSIPFLNNMPKFTTSMFSDVNTNSITSMFKSIFVVIENIINMLIDLLWAIMGLAPLFKKRPYLNISNDLPPTFDGNITDYIINMILGGEDIFIKGDVNATELLRSFVYDIQISDGRTLRDLDREELSLWISENQNLNIELNF
jgi:hypothetical protein